MELAHSETGDIQGSESWSHMMEDAGSMMGGWSSTGGMMGGGFWFGWVSMVLFWLILILGIIALLKWILSHSGRNNKNLDKN